MNFAGLLRNPIFIILVAVTVLAVTLGGLPMTLSAGGAGAPPPEESYSVGAMKAGVIGANDDPITGTVQFRGRADATAYVTSWSHEGTSEVITVTGKLSTTNRMPVDAYKYVLSVDTGSGFAVDREYGPIILNTYMRAGEVRALDTWSDITFTGPIVGVIKVDLWIKTDATCDGLFGRTCTRDWVRAAQDGARLLDGVGDVKLRVGASNLVEEGERVEFTVKSGVGGPWKLSVFDGTGALTCLPDARFTADVRGVTKGECESHWNAQLNGATFGFVVPVGAYRTDGANVWKVTLFNSITEQSAVEIFTVDKKRLAPEAPRVEEPSQAVEVGQNVRLKATSRGNPETNLPIKEFVFDAWCGYVMPPTGSDSWVLVNQRVPATSVTSGTYVATYEFRLDKACNILSYRAVAYDTAGRPSGSILNAADCSVLESQGIEDPNCVSEGQIEVRSNVSTHGGETPETRSKMSVLIVGLLLAILAFLVWYLLPVAPPVRMLIIVGGALIAVVFVGGVF